MGAQRHRERAFHALLLAATLFATCLADNKTVPDPISVAPDQNWEGIDGKWNTFSLRIGSPYQVVRVFVSTASQQTWAIAKRACMISETDEATNSTTEKEDSDCYNSRGWTFNASESTTWDNNGFYQLWIEQNLELSGNGQYGWDTVGLGLPGEMGPTLHNTTVGTVISSDFWLGHFGVNPKPTNFTNFTDPSPAYMSLLFEQNLIPSVSFGYTAGAQYHGDGAAVLGSLTLGGYDASRFTENDLTWTFAPDNERDIVVGIVDITATSTTKSDIKLLTRDPFSMYIDSTVAELWLPVEVCEAFETEFGLQYDNMTGLYLVDDELHDRLQAENPSVNFLLGQKYSSNATVNITLPYNAFDLQASPPYKGLTNQRNYFPIRRATRDNQFVLGRTFLQESYLIVDWERQNFSISACNWELEENKSIVPILSPKYTDEQAANSSSGLSTGAIIGIALGVGFAVVLSAVFAFVLWYRRRHRKRKDEFAKIQYAAQAAAAAAAKDPPSDKDEPLNSARAHSGEGTKVFPKAELPADSKHADLDKKDAGPPTMFGRLVEVENTERQIFEMEGDTPAPTEAGGRQLSEKETMMVREARYNGVDRHGAADVSPVEEAPYSRPPPLTGLDVAMVNRRLPVSPVTPLTPRTVDGASLEAGDTFFQPLQRPSPRDGGSSETGDTLLCPISPLEGSTDTSRRRFSYES
ncbi:acid protease [Bimuria novae-zelandiae CBS 107.79]|uniref:Acid protease n=1 Tax=Bimuria novae-zelandiae CBS 107.79 TaxID=1447943 RepID=A0A6A5V6K9_9PLEO|nr:acid protease [Bimuria novae-zelandiae CBS 107.79]